MDGRSPLPLTPPSPGGRGSRTQQSDSHNLQAFTRMNPSQPLSLAGRRMLDRRGFLGDFANGLGGIALAGLLSREGLLAAEGATSASGPSPRVDASLAPRAPHFAPRAK